MPLAQKHLTMGDFVDTDTEDRMIICPPGNRPGISRGIIINRGDNPIYFGWGQDEAPEDQTEASNVGFADVGEAINIPENCEYFAAKSPAGDSKFHYKN